MKLGNLGRFVLMFGGVMILAMVGIVTLVRANADDEPYFLLFWCICNGSDAGFYRVNPDGSGFARVTDAGLAPNTIKWSPQAMTLAQSKALAVRPGVYRMRWDGRVVRLLVEGRVDVVRTDWMRDGSLLVETGDGIQRQLSLTRVAAKTDESTLVNPEIFGTGVQASPDGEWLAYQSFRRGGYWHLYVLPFGGGDERQITDARDNDTLVRWSPDGERLLFIRGTIGASSTLYEIRWDGTGLRPLLSNGDAWRLTRAAYSPDGAWITYDDASDDQSDVWIVPADGGEARQLTNSEHNEHSAAWTRDSQWIAYLQTPRATGMTTIYRVRPDGSDVRTLISLDRVQNPTWSAPYAMDWQPGIAVGAAIVMLISSRYKVQGKSAKKKIEQKTRRREG